jgi:hypothetical protein
MNQLMRYAGFATSAGYAHIQTDRTGKSCRINMPSFITLNNGIKARRFRVLDDSFSSKLIRPQTSRLKYLSQFFPAPLFESSVAPQSRIN